MNNKLEILKQKISNIASVDKSSLENPEYWLNAIVGEAKDALEIIDKIVLSIPNKKNYEDSFLDFNRKAYMEDCVALIEALEKGGK